MPGALRTIVLLVVGLEAAAGAALAQETPAETIAVIQVHGNNVTADTDVIALAGVTVGEPFTAMTVADVRRRLIDSGRFEGAEVQKRFASIADPSRIALVIIVDEHAVNVELPGVPRADAGPRIVRRRWPGNAMWLPILDAEDGYGLTFGALVAWSDVAGGRSRISVPLSWGGQRQAGVEFDKTFADGPLSRVRAGVGITRRRNPFFDEPDTRRRVWGRADRRVSEHVWLGADAGIDDVTFAEDGERVGLLGADITFDTRLDPGLPRNAVFAKVSWARLAGERTEAFNTTTVDARGYVGLVRQSILIVRAEHTTSDRPRARFLKPLLGGWSKLRGFEAGAFAGDTRTVASVELRVPTSSPLSVAKAGISVFVDAGKAYDHGVRFDDAKLHVGAGAGVWLSATVVQAGVSVAHGRGGGTRVNVGIDLTF
jgi:outer membrane protein assembly factor BamA